MIKMNKNKMYSITLYSFIKAIKKEQNKGNMNKKITFSIDEKKNLTIYYGNNPIIDIYNDRMLIIGAYDEEW